MNNTPNQKAPATIYWWECSCGSEGKATRQQGRRSAGAGKHFQAAVRRGDADNHDIRYENT